MKKHLLYFLFILFSFHFADAQTWLWGEGSRNIGKFSFSVGAQITQDASHNVYLTGFFDDTTFFNKDTLIQVPPRIDGPEPNTLLAKYDYNGNLLWVRQSITTATTKSGSECSGNSVITDNIGNSYVLGSFYDTIAFGTDTLNNNLAVLDSPLGFTFLVKYDANGNVLWAKQSNLKGDTGSNEGSSVTCDNYRHIYATGSFFGNMVLDSFKLYDSTQWEYDVFLAKYDLNGNVLWAKQSTKPVREGNSGYGYSVATDKSGNVYVTGYFNDTISFGSYTLTSLSFIAKPPGDFVGDMFIAKYDSSGNLLWAKQSNATSEAGACNAYAIATDQYGNAYVTGVFEDSVRFGTYTLICHDTSSDVFLVKYNSNGNVLWAKQGTNLTMRKYWDEYGPKWAGFSVAVDTLNHVFLVGSGEGNSGYYDSIQFDSIKFANVDADGNDGPSFLVEFDSSGKAICGSGVNGGGGGAYVSVDPTDNYIYFGGALQSTTNFGVDTIGSPKSAGCFISRWQQCSGTPLETNESPVVNSSCVLFPNPASNRIQYIINSKDAIPAKMSVYDVLGKVITTGDLKLTEGENTFSLNTSGFSNGVYLLQINTADGTNVAGKKFVVER